jgi:hypothetical protein
MGFPAILRTKPSDRKSTGMDTGELKSAIAFLLSHILHLAVETAATQTKPAFAGYKTLDFWLVRTGGLSLYSPRIPF